MQPDVPVSQYLLERFCQRDVVTMPSARSQIDEVPYQYMQVIQTRLPGLPVDARPTQLK
jgi:hypothetical protein